MMYHKHLFENFQILMNFGEFFGPRKISGPAITGFGEIFKKNDCSTISIFHIKKTDSRKILRI